MAVADRHGLPVAVWTASGERHETKLVHATLAARFVEDFPEKLIGDRAYDSDPLDDELRDYGVEMISPHKVTRKSKTQDLGKCVDLGLKMLDAFILRVPRPEQVIDVERAFILELAHPVTGEVALVPLIGGIDAIVVDEGKVVVWELKTGKKKWSADQIEYDPQPTAYTMAARELGYGDVDVKLLVATKMAKPDVQVERLVRRRGDQRELAETVLDVLHAVKAGVDVRIRGWGCRSCAYAGVCGA
jgi:CRISPR/Cas system-associated exonuclease Cas4 (RecB family)